MIQNVRLYLCVDGMFRNLEGEPNGACVHSTYAVFDMPELFHPTLALLQAALEPQPLMQRAELPGIGVMSVYEYGSVNIFIEYDHYITLKLAKENTS